MRHGKKNNHLSRTHSHREAMLQNMASSLILHKRIETTLAKAKELRKFVEPILTRAKDDTFVNRREAFRALNDKDTMKELFGIVADKIASRPGGYTRIIKLGNRLGDNAETCLIELVDFNELLLAAASEKEAATTTKTRRSRRGTGARSTNDAAPVAGAVAVAATEEPSAEVVEDETPVTPVAETTSTEEAPAASAPTAEDDSTEPKA